MELRPLRMPEELDLAAGVFAAAETAVLGAPDTSRDHVEHLLTGPTVERTAAIEAEGAVVGLQIVERDATARETFVEFVVPPGVHAQAARDAALRQGEEGHPDGWRLRSGIWVGDEDGAAALRAHGYEPVRRFHTMRIASQAPEIPAHAPPLPAGAEIVVARAEAELREVMLVDNEAFRDHWSAVERGWEEWHAHEVEPPTRDPDGCWLVRLDGEPAAMIVLDDARAQHDEGYVALLGVRRPFRGRGLAQALLQRAFVHYRDAGRAATVLAVDADSQTNAVALYERVGMRTVRVSEAWQRPTA